MLKRKPGALRLGVIGCGNVVRKRMIPALQATEEWLVASFASRSPERARECAIALGEGQPEAYEAALSRAELDAVYVSLPPGLHEEWVCRALEAGKHVICEKPLAVGRDSALRMVTLARRRGLLLMENYMFVHHPQHEVVDELLESGAIGELRTVVASFGIPPLPAGDHRYDPTLGGGALLDQGGYPIRLASRFLSKGLRFAGGALLYDRVLGVDLHGAALLTDGAGRVAQLSFGFDQYYQCHYELLGSTGLVRVERAFTTPGDLDPVITLSDAAGSRRVAAPRSNHFVRSLERFGRDLLDRRAHEEHHESILEQARLRQEVRDGAVREFRSLGRE